MNARSLSPYRPNPVQGLLLLACIEEDVGRAGEYGLRWLSRVDLGNLDPASHRLLGALCWQLDRAGVRHAELPRLRGYFRRTWVENQSRLRRVLPVAADLAEAGIPALLLKGLALAFWAYPNAGMRPMADADLLIAPENAAPAFSILTSKGWTSASPPAWVASSAMTGCPFQYAVHLLSPEGTNLDLHWHCMDDCCYRGADDGFWARRVEFDALGTKLRTLCPEDHLLHGLIHGIAASEISPIRWITDAVWLIRRAQGRLDWDILMEEARRRRLGYLAAKALEALEEITGIGGPEALRRSLSGQKGTRLERWLYGGKASTSRWRKAGVVWLRYVRATRGMGWLERLVNFPRYLSLRWAEPNAYALVRHAIARTLGSA